MKELMLVEAIAILQEVQRKNPNAEKLDILAAGYKAGYEAGYNEAKTEPKKGGANNGK